MSTNKRGLFITFEGGEGTGKTTQSKMLYEYLKSIDIPVIWTREIGGTPIGEAIREIFFKYDAAPLTELLLSNAARNEHIINVIIPNIRSGVWVICDRFIDTNSVYRSLSGDFMQEDVYFWHANMFGEIWPDMTFLLDIDASISLKRVTDRGGQKSKYDVASLDFHESIRQGFLYSAALYPNRFRVIDANQDQKIIHQQIISNIDF